MLQAVENPAYELGISLIYLKFSNLSLDVLIKMVLIKKDKCSGMQITLFVIVMIVRVRA